MCRSISPPHSKGCTVCSPFSFYTLPNNLILEIIYVNSVNNKRAITALSMSVLHKVPVHYWLQLYNKNSIDHLLRGIGQHAHSVCVDAKIKTGKNVNVFDC